MNDENNFNIENKFINYGIEKKKMKKKKSKKIIFLIIFIILLVIAGYLFYANKLEKESNKKSNDNYEEYDPNYKLEESNSNIESNTTSNVTADITSNITSNIIITSNIVSSNSNQTSNKVSMPTVKVTDIKLNVNNVTMTVGDTKTLSTTITPNNASDKSVTWSSSNPSVATVDSSGKVTAKKIGSTTITVKTIDGNKTAKSTITVKDQSIPVSFMKINGSAYVLELNSEMASVYISPSNATNKKITWSSSNTKIAIVDQNGKITGVSPGSVTITATSSNGIKATKTYTVLANKFKVLVFKNAIGSGEGGVRYFYQFIAYNGNNMLDCQSITYNGKNFSETSHIDENDININKSISTATIKLGNDNIYIVPVTYTW